MRRRVLVGLVLVSLGCGSSEKGGGVTPIPLQGTLTPAAGLLAADFTVWGPADEAPSEVTADGAWSAQTYPYRTGILFASPKAGSAAVASLGQESGLYMTPAAGSARLVSSGGGLTVADDGGATMDATTTVMSMLLMHPMLGHASSDVSAEQLRWMVARRSSGWPCLAQAATAYDADLVARVDFSTDTVFTTALATCLNDVAAMPVFTPTPPAGKQALQLRAGEVAPAVTPSANRTARRFAADKDKVEYSVARDGVVVSSLPLVSADATSVVMEPKTATGTGLDYYYTVKAIDDDLTKGGTDSPVFASPNRLEVHSTTSTVAAGFIPASSYWSYLDVVGNTIKKVSGWVSSVVVDAPNNRVKMSEQHMYEVRIYSGGFGIGTTAAAYDFATTSFSGEHYAALSQNVTMAVVELVGVIPGAGEVLAEGDGGKILQAVVQKVMADLQTLIAAKGANVTGEDLYNLMYSVFKAAVDETIEVVTTDAQAGAAKRLLGYVMSGGKKVFKTVVGLPGKVAKGGSLGNRAFRLANPESVIEYYVVAVGYLMGDCEPFMNSMSIRLGPYPAECKDCANITCGNECTTCGDSCVETEDKLMTLAEDACQICNATGRESNQCADALVEAMFAGAYSPGSGQPEELAHITRVCVASACAACTEWNSGEGVCSLPP